MGSSWEASSSDAVAAIVGCDVELEVLALRSLFRIAGPLLALRKLDSVGALKLTLRCLERELVSHSSEVVEEDGSVSEGFERPSSL